VATLGKEAGPREHIEVIRERLTSLPTWIGIERSRGERSVIVLFVNRLKGWVMIIGGLHCPSPAINSGCFITVAALSRCEDRSFDLHGVGCMLISPT
jgi:hypothetical protein